LSAPRSAARSTPPAGVEPGRAVALLPLGASPFALCLLEARGEHPTAAAAAYQKAKGLGLDEAQLDAFERPMYQQVRAELERN